MVRWISLLLMFSNPRAYAAGEGAQTFTLDGRFYESTAQTDPLLDPSINITVSILDPTKDCVLYAEIQSISTLSTNGYFTIQVGSLTADSKRTAKDSGNTMAQTLQNVTPINGKRFGVNANCTYTPAAADARYLRVQVAPSTIPSSILTPDMALDSVPVAMVAESLQGLSRTDVLAVDSTGQLSQANLSSVFSNTNYPRLTALLGGTSTQYMSSSSTGGGALPSYTTATPPSAPAAGSIWYDSTSGAVKYYNGSSTVTLGASGAGLSSLTVSSNLTADGTAGGTLSAPGTIDLKDSGVTANTYTKVTVNAKGVVTSATNITGSDITSGTIGGSTAVNTTGAITTTGTVTGATLSGTNVTGRNVQYFDADTNKITVQAPALAADYSLTLPAADGSSGQALVTNGSGALSWASAGGGSATSVSATNGSAAAPSIAFSNDTDTGFYSSGTNTVGVAAGGTNIFNISSLGVESTTTGGGLMTSANGTAAAPTFSFSGDTDTGWFRPAANTIAAAIGGSERVRIDSTGQVGIGTTTPASALDVVGTISLGGLSALRYPSSDTTAGASIAIGPNALANQPASAAYNSLAVGMNAMSSANMTTAAYGNLAVGNRTMMFLTSGNSNTAVGAPNNFGYSALHSLTSGYGNTAVGNAALAENTTANMNTAVGGDAARGTTTGEMNTYVGFRSGFLSNGTGNSAIGVGALQKVTGSQNVSLGRDSGVEITSGGSNTIVGADAAALLTTGNSNVIIGRSVASTTLTTGSSNILIGTSNAVTTPANNTDNFLNIGNGIFGTGLTGTLVSPAGSIGIGTTAPGSALDVKGTLRLSGSTSGYVGLAPAATAGSTTYTLPSADGTSGQVLSTNGSGTLSWATASAGGSSSVSASAGTSSAPSISFSGDTNTGLYSSAADTIGITAGGSDIFGISSAGVVASTTGGGLMTSANGTAAAPTFSFSGDTDTGWFRPAADTLAASTGGTERVRITSNGRLGIGTTSPSEAFEVTGNARVIGTNAYVNIVNTGTQQWRLQATGSDFHVVNASTGQTAMMIEGYNPTGDYPNSIYIKADGSVGIGTTTPGSRLDVKGTLRLSGSTSGYVGLAPAAAAGSTTYTLPSADGSSGQLLSTNGSGTLSWVPPGGAMTAVTLTDGATISVDASQGNAWTVTLGGNRTLANPTNLSVGMYVLKVNQDATGNRALTWGTSYNFATLSSTLTTAANSYTIFSFFSDGSALYALSKHAPCISGSQIFTVSGTFTVPNGCTIRALVVGGGGAGSSNIGSGGGSGIVSQSSFSSASLSASVAVTVGAGGTGVVNADGSAGGGSSFGAYLTASGGNPGGGYSSGCRSTANGGSGGSGGGSASAAGGSGGSNGSSNTSYCSGGNGGSGSGAGSYNFTSFTQTAITSGSGGSAGAIGTYGGGGGGGGGVLIGGSGPTAGSPFGSGGMGYGAGGGGADYNQAGGSGSSGVVYVEWY